MSNVKDVVIIGELPFNCNEHDGMRGVLAALNAPVYGLRISYGHEPKLVPNGRNNGGRIALYSFSITGQEAVSNGYITKMILAITECGGNVQRVSVVDLENNRQKQDIQIPEVRKGVYVYSVQVQLSRTDIDRDEVNIRIGDYMKEVISDGIKAVRQPEQIQPFSVWPETLWSVRPA
jgi:hypothetical protein